jgi:polysaccharide deacetylase 2 family uncharacterized protein YibQ
MRRSLAKLENFIYLILLILFMFLVVYFNYQKLSGFEQKPKKFNIVEITQSKSVMDAINEAINLLEIPTEEIKITNGESAIYVRLGINGNRIDLNFANAIVTNQLDNIGAEVLSGEVRYQGSQQKLKIRDPKDDQIYSVILHYSKNYKKNKKTKLAVVIDDFGARNNQLLKDFCALDPAISFAILPDLKYSKLVMEMANQTGHETLIHVPMEPISYPHNDPGPNAIYVHLSENEIRKRMEKFIADFPLCAGMNNHMGSLVTSDPKVMKIVLDVVKEHNMYFVDSKTSQSSIAYSLAQKMMIPTTENKLFLDTPNMDVVTLKSKLRQLEYLQKKYNKILVITHCADERRLEFLHQLIKEIRSRDFELVPVSDFFKNELPDFS